MRNTTSVPSGNVEGPEDGQKILEAEVRGASVKLDCREDSGNPSQEAEEEEKNRTPGTAEECENAVSGSTEEAENTVSGSAEEAENAVSGSAEEAENTVSGSAEEAENTVSGSAEELENPDYLKLSERMRALFHLVPEGKTICDAGTDHGFLPIALVSTGRVPKALAMDLREGPLANAREHVWEAGLENAIQLRLSDGFAALKKDEAETAIVSGMGGALMQHILEDTLPDPVSMGIHYLILQPQSEVADLRRYLLDKGYRIEEEDMVFEEGKYYPMMRVYTMHPENVVMERVQTDSEDTAGHVSRRYPAEYLLYGGLLLQKADPVLLKYLSHRREILQGILQKMHAASKDSESSQRRRAETETELHILEETLRRYY